MSELIKTEIKLLVGKKVIVFFKYSTLAYNVRKSGKVLAADDKFFVLDERDDGRASYSYDFVVEVKEDKG